MGNAGGETPGTEWWHPYLVITYRFPGREAVAKNVSGGDRTTEIILTPGGK